MKITHRPDTFTRASPAGMASFKWQLCLCLYQPTHRNHPDDQQNPIRFRHLVKALETSLLRRHEGDAVKAMIEPSEPSERFKALAQDQDFWIRTHRDLAVLGAPGLFRVFLLQRPVAELVAVADSLNTKPLRHRLQLTGRCQILALSLDKVQLYKGDRNLPDAVAPEAGVPQTMTAALGDERTEAQATVSSYGGIGGSPMAMHHGQGGKKDEWRCAYAVASAKGLGGEVLSHAAHAAVASLVQTLRIEAGRQVAGRTDRATGRIDAGDLDNLRVDDVLDDLDALIESMGGEVHVLPADRMPCRAGVAASFCH